MPCILSMFSNMIYSPDICIIFVLLEIYKKLKTHPESTSWPANHEDVQFTKQRKETNPLYGEAGAKKGFTVSPDRSSNTKESKGGAIDAHSALLFEGSYRKSEVNHFCGVSISHHCDWGHKSQHRLECSRPLPLTQEFITPGAPQGHGDITRGQCLFLHHSEDVDSQRVWMATLSCPCKAPRRSTTPRSQFSNWQCHVTHSGPKILTLNTAEEKQPIRGAVTSPGYVVLWLQLVVSVLMISACVQRAYLLLR